MYVGITTPRTVFSSRFLPSKTHQDFPKSLNLAHESFAKVSLEFNVLLWKAKFHEENFDSVSLISLKDYLIVLRSPTASTKGLQLLSEATQVLVLIVDSFNYCRWFAEFSSFSTYFDPLLFPADLRAHAYVLRKSACWTDLCHIAQVAKRMVAIFKTFNVGI